MLALERVGKTYPNGVHDDREVGDLAYFSVTVSKFAGSTISSSSQSSE